MNKYNPFLILILSAQCGASLAKEKKDYCNEFFERFDDSFKKIREAHEKMRQEIFSDFESEIDSNLNSDNKFKINIDQDEKNVVIKIKAQVEDPALIKADSEDGILTAIIPAKDGDIKLKANETYLSIRSTKEVRKEKKDKDGNVISNFVEISNIGNDYMLPAKVDLNHVDALFVKESSEFILKISKKEKKSIVVETK